MPASTHTAAAAACLLLVATDGRACQVVQAKLQLEGIRGIQVQQTAGSTAHLPQSPGRGCAAATFPRSCSCRGGTQSAGQNFGASAAPSSSPPSRSPAEHGVALVQCVLEGVTQLASSATPARHRAAAGKQPVEKAAKAAQAAKAASKPRRRSNESKPESERHSTMTHCFGRFMAGDYAFYVLLAVDRLQAAHVWIVVTGVGQQVKSA